MRTRLTAAAVVAAAVIGVVQAQSPGPAFDVATIKPTPEADRGDAQPSIVMFLPGGGFRRTNSTLRTLVRTAYGVQPYQVAGGPEWADSDRFDIEARSEATPAPTRAQVLQMLQTLLADRFRLRIQRETRDGPVYHLVVASGGANVPPVTESSSANVRIGLYSGRRTMAQLADYLSSIVGRPVTDQAGRAHRRYRRREAVRKLTGFTALRRCRNI